MGGRLWFSDTGMEWDGNGNRINPAEQLERLKQIKRQLNDGRRPAQVVPVSATAFLPHPALSAGNEKAGPNCAPLHPVVQ